MLYCVELFPRLTAASSDAGRSVSDGSLAQLTDEATTYFGQPPARFEKHALFLLQFEQAAPLPNRPDRLPSKPPDGYYPTPPARLIRVARLPNILIGWAGKPPGHS